MAEKHFVSARGKRSSDHVGHEASPYDGPLGMEEDDDMTGGDVETKYIALAADEEMLPGILAEEEPYLGWDGMAGEQGFDLIEMRDDEAENAPARARLEHDAFTESMDVFDEDLENFTEDMDDKIDSSLE